MLDLAVAVGENKGLIGAFIGMASSWILVLVSDNEENVQADHVGGSLSLSTSPHRRSLEALGLLHNSGASMLLLLVTKNVTMKVTPGILSALHCTSLLTLNCGTLVWRKYCH